MHKLGILLVNLGSPNSPSVSGVRKYLREFLMDPRVIDVPYPLRLAVVYGGILPFRPRASAEAYARIWTEQGSPLVVVSASLQRRLRDWIGLPVELGMRYQNPTIQSALARLMAAGVDDALIAPLFPHHARSSYESAVERVKQVAASAAPRLRLTVLPPYFDRPEYIEALAASAAPYLEHEYDHLLFSFHGVPERHLRKANPDCRDCLNRPDCSEPRAASRTCYRRHCLETMNRFAAVTGLTSGSFSFAFQSRLGVDAWLNPCTHDEIVRLARSGVRKLMVICPAFTVDCLETIEEIGMRAKEAFLEAGGREFTRVPCLNDHPAWVDALARMACGQIAGVQNVA
jgi:Protoheme ferro-lyase (ferrochelatase)